MENHLNPKAALLIGILCLLLGGSALARELASYGELVASTADDAWCGEAISIDVSAPSADAFSGDKVSLQRLTGGVRALLGFECPQAKAIRIRGIVEGTTVYTGVLAEASQWVLVDIAQPKQAATEDVTTPSKETAPAVAAIQEIPEAYLGTWIGTVTQPGYDPYSSELTISAAKTGNPAGTYVLAEGGCRGTFTFVEASSVRLILSQKLEHNELDCADGSTLNIRRKSNETLELTWTPPAGGQVGIATLTRAAAPSVTDPNIPRSSESRKGANSTRGAPKQSEESRRPTNELVSNCKEQYASVISRQGRHKFRDVLETCLFAMDSDPKHPDVHFTIGKIHLHESRFAEAIPYLEFALDKGLYGARTALGETLLVQNADAATNQRGLSLLQTASEADEVRADWLLGYLYMHTKLTNRHPILVERDLPRARTHLEKVTKGTTDEAAVHMETVKKALAELGRIEELQEKLHGSIKISDTEASYRVTQCEGRVNQFVGLKPREIVVTAPNSVNLSDQTIARELVDRARRVVWRDCPRTSAAGKDKSKVTVKVMQNGRLTLEGRAVNPFREARGEYEDPINHEVERKRRAAEAAEQQRRREIQKKERQDAQVKEYQRRARLEAHRKELAEKERRRLEQEKAESRAKLDAFAKSAGIELWFKTRELSVDPFLHEGKVVGLITKFRTMVSRDTGLFGTSNFGSSENLLLISKIPTAKFQSAESVMVAGQVVGKEYVKLPIAGDTLVLHLEYVDAYLCQENGCSEMLRWSE